MKNILANFFFLFFLFSSTSLNAVSTNKETYEYLELFGQIFDRVRNEYVDEVWLMPMYKHALEYISAITKKPVKICPYVWNSDLITKYIDIAIISINTNNPYFELKDKIK